MKKLLSTLALSAAALAVLGTVAARAADIPCDTARLIVPWNPGGGTHVLFSIFEKTVNELGGPQKLKVVTIPGQGGNKGAKEAAKAKPDGCTLFAIHQSAITSFLNGRINFQFDGFETVANLTATPDIVGAAADTSYKNFEDFAAHARANPGKIKVGATFGSTCLFICLMFADMMCLDLSYVPYDGTRERMTALLSGAIDMGVLNVASGRKYLSGGELQGFAIAADERSKFLPDMPTLKELGVDMTFGVARGIVAPKGTPKDVIDQWSAIFKQAAESPDLLAQMDAKGTAIAYQNPDEYRAWAEQTYTDFEGLAIKVGMYKK